MSNSAPSFLAADDQAGVVARPMSTMGLRLMHLGCETVPMRYHERVLENPWWRLYIVDRPGLHLECAGHRLAYPVDGIMVIPGWCRYRFLATPGVWHGYIHFETTDVSSVIARRLFPGPLVLGDSPDLLARLRTLARRLVAGHTGEAEMHQALAICHDALGECLGLLPRDTRDLASQSRERISASVAYIQGHLDQPIQVEDLARIAGVSRDHCVRQFRDLVGMTPMQFVLEQRVNRAAALLARNELGIDEIARLCGFADRGYLTRIFGRRMGITPARYRHLHAQEAIAG